MVICKWWSIFTIDQDVSVCEPPAMCKMSLLVVFEVIHCTGKECWMNSLFISLIKYLTEAKLSSSHRPNDCFDCKIYFSKDLWDGVKVQVHSYRYQVLKLIGDIQDFWLNCFSKGSLSHLYMFILCMVMYEARQRDVTVDQEVPCFNSRWPQLMETCSLEADLLVWRLF